MSLGKCWIGFIGIIAAGLGFSATAWSQGVEFSANNFRPAIAPMNYYVTEGGQTLPHLAPSASLLLHYAHRPLQLVDPGDSDFDHGLINYQFNADVLLALGLFDRVELGLGLPVTLAQGSDGLENLGRSPGATLSAGLGDLRIVPKVRIFTMADVTLALAAAVAVPTGSTEDLLGGDGVTFTPQIIGSYDIKPVSVALNVGYRVRKDQTFFAPGNQQEVTIDDQVPISLGVKVPVHKKVDLIGDFFMAIATSQQDAEEVPAELLLGARYMLPYNLVASLGGGPGLTQGIGTPTFRILGGISYLHQPEPEPVPLEDPDRDRDGILNVDDQCPDQPEDTDGFEDEDGCPDPDNDKDGILDVDDKCPLEPEDKDAFEDEDGCPDWDNDNDGIKDVNDKCPLEPEDMDGFEDIDGCPDLDNDKDGIKDADDKCPMEPETFNGVDDEDGCPDLSKGPVQIQRGKITVPSVFFATNKDIVLKRSLPTLKQIAETLDKNQWIKKVRVEGHTDDRGSDEFNQDLSQRRADSVMRHLVGYGVATDRLEAKGYGESRPLAPNKTAKGRAENRRVEFVITDPVQRSTDSATSGDSAE